MKDTTIHIRIRPKDKDVLRLMAKYNGLTISDLLNLKIDKMISDFKLGIVDNDVKAKVYDKIRKKQGVLNFEDIKIKYHY